AKLRLQRSTETTKSPCVEQCRRSNIYAQLGFGGRETPTTKPLCETFSRRARTIPRVAKTWKMRIGPFGDRKRSAHFSSSKFVVEPRTERLGTAFAGEAI